MSKAWFYILLIALGALLVVIAWPEDPLVTERVQAPAEAGETSADSRAFGAGEPAVAAEFEITDLYRRLDEEIRLRRELEDRMQALERELASLRADTASSALLTANTAAAESEASSGGDEGDRPWFDEQALLASGMDEASARELRLFFEQLEFERLRLRDRASREGWESARRRDEFALLEDREASIRDRLGDDGYAAYLYAAGRSNRVEVTSVLASAPAGQAGIQAGDQILRYADERIYSPRELRAAISDGDIDELVEVEVERDGQSLRFYLSRGPLGVRTNSLSVAP